MSDFGPNQVSMSLFFDHSGQDLFEESAPSMLNTMGLSADYAPWPYLSIGVFGGGAELDVDLPDSRVGDDSAFGFDTDLSLYGGASGKLATPRFAGGTTRLVAHGSAAWFNAEDANRNVKRGLMCNAGATLQFQAWGRMNFVLGGEFQAILRGEQESPLTTSAQPFGLAAPSGPIDYMRGIIGVEYFFKGKNQPFLSVAVRPTGATNVHDHLGLRNASISVSLGAIATLPSKWGGSQIQEEEPGLAED
jgi:hypothetical protein